MKELVDFVMLKSLSSQRDGNALLVLQRPMSLSLIARNLKYNSQEDRVASQKESHLVTAILTRRQPSVEACGEMMSFDGREAGSLIQFCSFDLRTVEVRTAGATFSSVSLALDDVRCH